MYRLRTDRRKERGGLETLGLRKRSNGKGGQGTFPALPTDLRAGETMSGKIVCGVMGGFLLAFWAGLLWFHPSLGAAQSPLLEEKHKNAGLACEACHKESPPANQVPMEACQGCHGDYSKLAEQTGKKKPNPHDSHEGPIACEKCHHNHKPSANYCASCHNFGFRVP
jgi:hypothetical protein